MFEIYTVTRIPYQNTWIAKKSIKLCSWMCFNDSILMRVNRVDSTLEWGWMIIKDLLWMAMRVTVTAQSNQFMHKRTAGSYIQLSQIMNTFLLVRDLRKFVENLSIFKLKLSTESVEPIAHKHRKPYTHTLAGLFPNLSITKVTHILTHTSNKRDGGTY